MTEEIKEEETTEEIEKVEPKKKTLEIKEEIDFEIIDGVKYPKKVIQEARSEGWRQKDSFKGDNNKYLTPDKFVERGQKLPAFLNKKLNDKDSEIKDLKKLLEKNFKTQVIDKIDTVNEKLEEASEMGEVKKVASMTRKKVNLERELAELSKEEAKKPQLKQPEIPQKPLEMLAWEMKNSWLKTDERKKNKANEFFNKINNNSDCNHLSLKQRLALVDINLKDYDSTNKQKKNLSAPIGQTKTSLPTGKITRGIKHLKPALKKQFDEHMVGNDGKKFTGQALKLATESFLNACDDSHFNK